jgi:gas vesicle protein
MRHSRNCGFFTHGFQLNWSLNMANTKPANEDVADQGSAKTERSGQQECGEDGKGRQPGVNIAVSTLRSLGQFLDMQAATSRIMWRAQARAASAFGAPDYSRLFQVNDDRGQRLFSAATDNLTQILQQADGPLTEVPSQFSRMLEQQTINLTERWKYGLEEMQQQATESMKEIKELSLQQAEEMARTTESLTEATRATLREGGEQFRATVRQGREIAAQQAETLRQETERAAAEVEDEVRESRQGAERGRPRANGGQSTRAS